MYAAAGGASLAGRKARQHGRQPAPSTPSTPVHPAPTGVRAYSCQHWESRLAAPPTNFPRPLSSLSEPRSPCDVAECAAGRAAWQEAAALSVGGGGAGAGGAARRCSVLGDHPGARRDLNNKWRRNNRVRDASYGSSSESDGEPDGAPGEPWGVARLLYAGLGTLALGLVVYFVGTGDKAVRSVKRLWYGTRRTVGAPGEPWGMARLFYAGLGTLALGLVVYFVGTGDKAVRSVKRLWYGTRRTVGAPGEPWGMARLFYAGLGTLALGLVVYFVGTGDKGFKTPALRLVGPSLIVAGLACCLIRIAFCIFAKPCCRRRTNYKENRRLDGCGEGEEMPLARGPRTGPAQCSPARRLDASSCDVSSLSSGEEDERLRRYRTAAPPPPPASMSAPAHLQQSTVQQITVQQKPEPAPTHPSAMTSGANRPRPPPRNVSFAGPEGELVLSPAQLRS